MSKFLASAVLMFTLAGCGIDAALDCRGICTRYRTCFDASYDVQACEERCRTNAMNDSTYRAKADSCKACLDSASCTTAVFTCGVNCTAVVP